jgi:Secretion system C-terminal sorting domain/SprB repeat
MCILLLSKCIYLIYKILLKMKKSLLFIFAILAFGQVATAQTIKPIIYYTNASCAAGAKDSTDFNGFFIINDKLTPFNNFTLLSGNKPTPSFVSSNDTIFFTNLRIHNTFYNNVLLSFLDSNAQPVSVELFSSTFYGNFNPIVPYGTNEAFVNNCDSSYTVPTAMNGLHSFQFLRYYPNQQSYLIDTLPKATVVNNVLRITKLIKGASYNYSFLDNCNTLRDRYIFPSKTINLKGGNYICGVNGVQRGVKLNATPPFTLISSTVTAGINTGVLPSFTFYGDSISFIGLRPSTEYQFTFKNGCNDTFKIITSVPVEFQKNNYNDLSKYAYYKGACNNTFSIKIKAPSVGPFYNAIDEGGTYTPSITQQGSYIIIGNIPNATNTINISYRDSNCHHRRYAYGNEPLTNIMNNNGNVWASTMGNCALPSHIALKLNGVPPFTVSLISGTDPITYSIYNDSLILSNFPFFTYNNYAYSDYNFSIVDSCGNTKSLSFSPNSFGQNEFSASHTVVIKDESGGCSGMGYANGRAKFFLEPRNPLYQTNIFHVDSIKGAGSPSIFMEGSNIIHIRNLIHDSIYTFYYTDSCNNHFKHGYKVRPANTPMTITPLGTGIDGLCPVATANNLKLYINTTAVNFPAKVYLTGAKTDSIINLQTSQIVFSGLSNGTYQIQIIDSCNNVQALTYTISNGGQIGKYFTINNVGFNSCDSIEISVSLQYSANQFNTSAGYGTFKGPFTLTTTFAGNVFTKVINDTNRYTSKYFTYKIPNLGFNLAQNSLTVNLNTSCGNFGSNTFIDAWNAFPKIICENGISKRETSLSSNSNYTGSFKFPLKVIPYFSNTADTATRIITSWQQYNFVFKTKLSDSIGYKIYDACGNLLDIFVSLPYISTYIKTASTRGCTNNNISKNKGTAGININNSIPSDSFAVSYISGPQVFTRNVNSPLTTYYFYNTNGYLYLIDVDTGTYVVQIKSYGQCNTITDTMTVRVEPFLDSLYFTFIPGCLNNNKLVARYYTNLYNGSTNYKLLTASIYQTPTVTNTNNYYQYSNNYDTLYNLASNTMFYINGSLNNCNKRDSILSPTYINPTIAGYASFSCTAGYSLAILGAKGVAPYTYEILSGTPVAYSAAPQASNVFSNLPGAANNVYQVRLIDACGNGFTTLLKTDTIKNPVTITGFNCVGNNYQAWVDSIPNISYSWIKMATNTAINGPVLKFNPVTFADTGAYKLRMVNNITGCTNDTIYNISIKNCLLTIKDSVTNIKCNGNYNGSVYTSVFGGTAPYIYNWNTGSTASFINNKYAGTYILTVTDATNTVFTKTYIISQPDELVVTSTYTDETCQGKNDGTMKAFVAGGTLPYSYNWSNYGSTTDSISNLSPTIYYIVIIDGNGCNAISGKQILPAPPYSAYIYRTNSCAGNATGSVDALGNGGNAPYTYLWSNGSTDDYIDALNVGTYSVVVTDATGCTATNEATVADVYLASNYTVSNQQCAGQQSGYMLFNTANGEAPYTYEYDGGAPTYYNYNYNLDTGTHIIITSDLFGCEIIDTIKILPASPIAITLSKVNSCNADSNGKLTINITGGAGNYYTSFNNYPYYYGGGPQMNRFGYFYMDRNIDSVIVGLDSGTYYVDVQDSLGCAASANIYIGVDDVLPNLVTTDIYCGNANLGSATIAPTGGSAPYTAQWSNGITNINTINNLAVNEYSVIVIDANGCSKTAIDSVKGSSGVSITLQKTNECVGSTLGTIAANVSGGATPYMYAWSNADTTNSIANASAGNYSVTVTDNNGCTNTAEDSIKAIVLINDITVYNEMCVAQNNGYAMMAPMGGDAPYTWDYGNGLSGNNFSPNKAPGIYTFNTYDANGCNIKDTIEILPALPILITATKANSCMVDSNGKILINITGGTGKYTTTFTNTRPRDIIFTAPKSGTFVIVNNIDTTITGLDTGVYIITAIDENGCTSSASVTIAIDTIIATLLATNESCEDLNDGSITASIYGGQSPIKTTWSNGDTNTLSIYNLLPATYSVVVQDANGCSITANKIVDSAAIIKLTITNNPTCANINIGSLSAAASGGALPIQYIWSNGKNTAMIDSLIAGMYSLTVVDIKGCIVTAQDSIKQTAISTSKTIVHEQCAGANNGSISINAIDGTAPYTYNFGTGFTTNNSLANAMPNTYNIIIKDVMGCDKQESVIINAANPISMNVAGVNACMIDGNGKLNISINGGTNKFASTYANSLLNTSATFELVSNIDTLFTNLSQGVYTITGTDENGCTKTSTTIIAIDTILANVTIVDNICFNNKTGSASAIPAGGKAPYSYIWSNSATSALVSNLAADVYNLAITDNNGCSIFENVEIKDGYQLQATSATTNACSSSNNGIISITPINGIAPYQANWNGTFTNNLINTTTTAGIHIFKLKDANGCELAMQDTVLATYVPRIDTMFASTLLDSITIVADSLISNLTYAIIDILPNTITLPAPNTSGNFATSGASFVQGQLSHDGCISIAKSLAISSTPLGILDIALHANTINEHQALLKWTCLETEQIVNYTIQKSMNGIDYTSINSIPAATVTIPSIQKYTTIDNDLQSNKIQYYRVVANTAANKMAYSNVVTLSNALGKNDVILYPNPAATNITIEFGAEKQSTAQIVIMDAIGKTIAIYTSDVDDKSKTIDISKLANGYYNIIVTQEKGNHNFKLIKK